jgi:hypothetical protein
MSLPEAIEPNLRLPEVNRLTAMPHQHPELFYQYFRIAPLEHDQAARCSKDVLENFGAGLDWGSGQGHVHRNVKYALLRESQ